MSSDDICRNRHRGSPESEAAFKGMRGHRLAAMRATVLAACSRPGGITCRELAHELGVGLNVISGRFSDLKKSGEVMRAGRRGGCAILIATGSAS